MITFDEILGGLEERGALGQCAKQRVRCELILRDGTMLVGENWCMNPQQVCPREPGEGYEKCRSICRQLGHAEQVVARYAEDYDFTGATATLYGHTYFCKECQDALFSAGVKFLALGDNQ